MGRPADPAYRGSRVGGGKQARADYQNEPATSIAEMQ